MHVLRKGFVQMERGTIDVFKKFKLPRFSRRGRQRQRGQLVLLYALFVPLIFFFVGLTFDLSWYYLNVSRMQNAADAAAVAGAQTLIGEDGSLSYCMGKSFVKGYDGKNVKESYQNTSFGDRTAKTYVGKNLAKGNTDWNDNTIIDLWTKNELSFDSLLLSEANDTGTLYYHVMLEEEVPHMFLSGLSERFPMNAKVSSVVMINQYMKGYDFFEQMKSLEKRQTSSSFDNVKKKNTKSNDEETVAAAKERSVLTEIVLDENNHRQVEIFNLSDKDELKKTFDTQKIFNSLFIGTQSISNNKDSRAIHRIINIDTVYPVRDDNFYSDYKVLSKVREDNPAYDDMSDNELISALAKDSFDPLFIRIESEAAKDRLRQVIINVNVSNMNEMTDRPIFIFYEGDVNGNSFPVIVNLNADFRGVIFAPNSPVVINGNDYTFQGFVIADSYVELVTEDDDDNYYPIRDEHENLIYVDYYGNVQYKNQTITPTAKAYNLFQTKFDSFELVKFDTYKPDKKNIFFTTEEAKAINKPDIAT